MRFGSFDFRPRWVPTLVTALLLPLLISLGVWQVNRAHEKEAMIAAREQAGRGSAQALAAMDLDAKPKYQVVRAQGRYDRDHQFLLDNQTYNGRVGYQVLTPFRVAGSGRVILVARGWVPAPASRDRKPEFPTPAGEITVRGRFAPAPSTGVHLGEPIHPGEDWPVRVEWVDYDALSLQLGTDLPEAVVELDPDEAGGFVRHWTYVGLPPARHWGYAFQWFMLAGTLLAIYIGVNSKRRRK